MLLTGSTEVALSVLCGYNIDILSPRLGEALTYAIRNARRLCLKPSLVLSHSDFEQLVDFWPRFYLTGPVVPTRGRGRPCSWLRRLLVRFVRRGRVSPPPLLSPSDEILQDIKERMLKKQAVPVDGVWVPVRIVD